ncbi:rod shape-determining protein MreD [Nocardioides sp.]|uniref:rod shape-determining protein MreD n=1 Tax=Nocardioides sp. TaxID=35761 RepID=UPI0039E38A88
MRRWGLLGVLVVLALMLQVSVLDAFAWHGIVPDLALLVVVGAALVRGSEFGLVAGFAAGVLLDVAPPADHLAGRWALALLVVGYLAGRVGEDDGRGLGQDRRRIAPTVAVATVAAASFVGSSLFALTGLLFRDPAVGTGDLLATIGISLVWDVLLAPFVLPPVMAAFRAVEPGRA